MQQRIKRLALGAILLMALTACEKVISPDIKDAGPRLVIEANLPDGDVGEVRISLSTSFTQETAFEGVSGAVVTLTDDQGSSETLPMISPGIYRTVSMQGQPGHTYTLSVTYDGKSYTGNCRMPSPVNIDTVYQVTQIVHGNTRRFLIPVYSDPETEINYYRIKVWDGAVPLNKIFVRNDELTNGTTVTQPVGPYLLDLVPGDTAQVFLYGIDESVYRYFAGLEQTLDGNSAAPSNPESNLSGGCLGYFSAHSVAKKQIVITE